MIKLRFNNYENTERCYLTGEIIDVHGLAFFWNGDGAKPVDPELARRVGFTMADSVWDAVFKQGIALGAPPQKKSPTLFTKEQLQNLSNAFADLKPRLETEKDYIRRRFASERGERMEVVQQKIDAVDELLAIVQSELGNESH